MNLEICEIIVGIQKIYISFLLFKENKSKKIKTKWENKFSKANKVYSK